MEIRAETILWLFKVVVLLGEKDIERLGCVIGGVSSLAKDDFEWVKDLWLKLGAHVVGQGQLGFYHNATGWTPHYALHNAPCEHTASSNVDQLPYFSVVGPMLSNLGIPAPPFSFSH